MMRQFIVDHAGIISLLCTIPLFLATAYHLWQVSKKAKQPVRQIIRINEIKDETAAIFPEFRNDYWMGFEPIHKYPSNPIYGLVEDNVLVRVGRTPAELEGIPSRPPRPDEFDKGMGTKPTKPME